MEVLSCSTGETKNLARRIALKLEPGAVLALYGELGSGKTTFTGFLVEALGVSARVQSPTFVIMRKYSGSGHIRTVNHLDLYRLTSSAEANELGIEEIFDEPDSISVVEWPELIENMLPTRTIRIKFEYVDETKRKINVQNLY